MKILNSVEREGFDLPPIFNSAERKRCFDFPAPILQIATSLRTNTNQVVFLMSCGYFKATKRFYPVPTFHQRDLVYVADRIANAPQTIDLTSYPKQSMARNQATILEFYGFRPFKPHGRALLAAEIARLVQSHLKPKLIFSRAVEVLVRDKVEVPGYFSMAALILTAINQHNRRLTATIETLLTQETRALLDTLLLQEATEEGSPPGKTVAYKLTLMKKLSQSTKPSKVKERVADLQLVHERFRLLTPVEHLNLGSDGIQPYAYGVIKAEIFQLTRRGAHERYLHLTAFIAHQYYRLHDNLVDVLLSSLRSFQNSAQCEHKDQCYVRREQRNDSLKTLVGFLDHGVLETFAKIKGVTEDSELSDTEKVQRISALLADNHVATSLDADQIDELKAAVATELSEDDYYLILAAKSVRLQNRVSPILRAVAFLAEPSARELRQAIEYFKLKDGAIDKTAPVEFLTPEERQAVSRDGRFSVSLYKALLFLQVQSGIRSGTLNLEHSYKYRPLDAYLIDRGRWQRDKSLLIERAGLQGFVDPHRVLAKLDEALYQQYLTTNTHILDGENPHITFKKVGFTVSTPTQEESEAGSMQQFFPERDFVPMLEILATVNHHTGWMEEFQHWQQRHQSWPSRGPGHLRRRYWSWLYHRHPQDGADFSSLERDGAGECHQLVLLGRQRRRRE